MFRTSLLLLSACILCASSFSQSNFNASSKNGGAILDSKLETLPIKPARTISFTTNEASWIDVDISPDGKTLLCSFLGNLYSLPSAGGTAKQLTRGLAINRYPVFSPDGKLKAFMSDATGFMQIHVEDSLGTFYKALGKKESSRYRDHLNLFWLPDSKHISDGNQIYDLNGGSFALPEKIRNVGAVKIFGFSQEGKCLYMLIQRSDNSTELAKLDTLTGNREELLLIGKPHYFLKTAKISPDGNWLTYIKYDYINGNPGPADSLIAIDLKTGKEKLLAYLGIKFVGDLDNQHYSFSSDSKYLLIGYGGKIHQIETSSGRNEVIPFTANVKVDMGALDYHTFTVSLDSFEVKYIRSAERSPDGKHLVFSALSKIYTMDLPYGKSHVLFDQPFGQFQPSYSPDGRWITYVSWSSSVKGHVWRIPSNGGKAEQLTTLPSLYEHPSWSPDGKKIIVVEGHQNLANDYPMYVAVGQVQVINVENRTIESYLNNVPLLNYPNFSVDAKQVLFKPNQNGHDGLLPKLIALNVENKAQKILATALKKDDYSAFRQVTLSPDGRYLVFWLNGDLYLTPMTNAESPQMLFDEKVFNKVIRFARGGIDARWEKDGKVISWLNGNHFYSIDPDKIMKAAMKLQPNATLESLPKTKIIDVDIPADQVIIIHLKAPTLYGKGTIALNNARIVTMQGGKVIKKGTIIIENGRLIKIGESRKLKIPKEATVIDLSGKTILPGFIDIHNHSDKTVPPDVINEQSWQQLLLLSHGVTTARDPNGSFDQFGRCELQRTGHVIGTRLFSVGGAVMDFYNLANSKDADVVVNNRVDMGATFIKQYTQPTRLQKQLLLEACKKAKVNMTNEKEEEPLYYLGMIKDGSTGVEHTATWGEVYNDLITTVAKSGTYICPTLQVCHGFPQAKFYFTKRYGNDFLNRSGRFISENYREQLEDGIKNIVLDTGFLQQSRIVARIKHAGGKIVMGSHGEDQGIGAHWEIWALQMGGLTNHEALETATITAAEALGMQKDLGSIEVGKIADLIILDKNPLGDIHNTNTIKYVMKAGVLYDSETLDEIWPEKKKCPEWRMKPEVK